MTFTTEILIRFHHCDPAGIVFYPRYFEMVNMVVEDWFARALGAGFDVLSERREGIPTVRVECDFLRPSMIGDVLVFELEVEHIGTTSFSIRVRASKDGEERLRMRGVLVYVQVGRRYRKLPIPPAIRARMQQYLTGRQDG